MEKQEYFAFRYYERIMKMKPEGGRKQAAAPKYCWDCVYYRPHWKYRSCLYARCPFQTERRTIRKKPLMGEIFPFGRPGPGAVMAGGV